MSLKICFRKVSTLVCPHITSLAMSAFDTLRNLLNSRHDSIRGFLIPHLIRLIDSADNQGDQILVPAIQRLIEDLSDFRVSTLQAVDSYAQTNPVLPFVVPELQDRLPPRIEIAPGIAPGIAFQDEQVPDEFDAQAPSVIPREDLERMFQNERNNNQ